MAEPDSASEVTTLWRYTNMLIIIIIIIINNKEKWYDNDHHHSFCHCKQA